jgi:hypothetical protein
MEKTMKALLVVLLVVLCASVTMAQSYVERNGNPYSRTLYGGASFAVDSHYVAPASGWMKVTAKLDSTAGTTTAWICFGNDSTNAIPIRPGTGGAYGDGQTFLVYRETYYRVKGAVPLTVTIE